ncbi:glutamine synthetase family protein [Sphaerochaeta sp. PS]|uniref:glutamine synthetase family protein n=1 Tax=Sphaerochaeta sp. PS TaxID=3076336 RepID=UPI0028A53C0E|nr:glutamine synthetase family protein [Sphaerochaeta sp. PS]MDT4762693.1 glutamine synthetase family protein [Sphaerochaeta sp. PS]
MTNTQKEVLQFIKEQDVRFVRLVFCDIFGHIKNLSISEDELDRAFATGISFDASAVKGFLQVDESDLLLFPDPSTLAILPWRPAQGRVVRFFCSIRRPDGTPFEGDGRSLLEAKVREAELSLFKFGVGPECEFYLFKMGDDGLPTYRPLDNGTYLDVAPLDKGENVRREICLTLQQMGFHTERSHHESGPGQNEIDFKYSPALEAADNFITFKSVVKTIADRSGLFASFLPKPLAHESGSGLHINLSLSCDGEQQTQRLEEAMTEGILRRIKEITLFLNPLANSYERLGACEAPRHVGWGRANRSLLIRIPQTSGEYRRIEVRSPDPACNPYLAITLLISAALEGVKDNLKASEEYLGDAYQKLSGEMLPSSLGEAIDLAQKSEFVRSVIPERLLTFFLEAKMADWKRYESSIDKMQESRAPFFLTT